jgi:hypothetical protein
MKRIITAFSIVEIFVACAPRANWEPLDVASNGIYPGEAWQKAITL